MEIFEKLPDEINHLVSEFSSTPVVGDLSCGITQYSFWLIVSTIVLLIVLAVFKKKQALVPKGFFVNGFEYIIEYVENDIGKGVVGENWKKHFPFLCSLFLFILINNMIGLIPGMKPGTGAIGSTAALAIFAFVYFMTRTRPASQASLATVRRLISLDTFKNLSKRIDFYLVHHVL